MKYKKIEGIFRFALRARARWHNTGLNRFADPENRRRDFQAPVVVSKAYRIFPAREGDKGAMLYKDCGAKTQPGIGHRIIDLRSSKNVKFVEWLTKVLS